MNDSNKDTESSNFTFKNSVLIFKRWLLKAAAVMVSVIVWLLKPISPILKRWSSLIIAMLIILSCLVFILTFIFGIVPIPNTFTDVQKTIAGCWISGAPDKKELQLVVDTTRCACNPDSTSSYVQHRYTASTQKIETCHMEVRGSLFGALLVKLDDTKSNAEECSADKYFLSRVTASEWQTWMSIKAKNDPQFMQTIIREFPLKCWLNSEGCGSIGYDARMYKKRDDVECYQIKIICMQDCEKQKAAQNASETDKKINCSDVCK